MIPDIWPGRIQLILRNPLQWIQSMNLKTGKKCKDHVDITQNSIDTPQSTSMDPILDEIIFNSF